MTKTIVQIEVNGKWFPVEVPMLPSFYEVLQEVQGTPESFDWSFDECMKVASHEYIKRYLLEPLGADLTKVQLAS